MGESCTSICDTDQSRCKPEEDCVLFPDHPALDGYQCIDSPCKGVTCQEGKQCYAIRNQTAECLNHPCEANPCFNNGTCVLDSNTTYHCRCPKYYDEKVNCQLTHFCSNNLSSEQHCQNGGTCNGEDRICPPGR